MPDTSMTADSASRQCGPASVRCPHVVFRNVLGLETVASLLDYVALREKDFRPGMVRNRQSGQPRVNPAHRDCVNLTDLGPFDSRFKTFVHDVMGPALKELQLDERAVEAREFEICAYRNNGHFGVHMDTSGRLNRVRVLSCVYYFATTPRRFGGGELRLHGFPMPSDRGAAPPFVDIEPETDTLVVFPSWLRHEVLPVAVPSTAWTDGRFTINCWIHRREPTGGDASGQTPPPQ
jgi:SM-20-related protein